MIRQVASRVAEDFLKGSLVLLPVVGSVYAAWYVLAGVDNLVAGVLPTVSPGVGLVLAVITVTATGAFASNVIGRRLIVLLDDLLDRVPVIRLLYGSIRDLMAAFVGEKKSFDRPVVVEVGGGVRVLGFLTVDHFDEPELAGLVAVYLPQSYNFAGNLILVPQTAVQPVNRAGIELLTFIASGGVSGKS